MKKTLTASGALLAALILTACSTGNAATVTSPSPTATAVVSQAPVVPVAVNIASLKGPTTMGLVGLMDDATKGTAPEDYKVQMYASPDEVVPLVAKGSVDMALVPSNLAAVLYAKTKGTDAQISVLAINTLGVLNIVESGDTIHSIADLKGKTVYLTGKGASPEYVMDYLLEQAGLKPGVDVDLQFLSEHTEVVAKLTATPGAIGVLPQPFVTIAEAASPDLRTALDLTSEWAKVSPDSQLITGVVVVRNSFATEHPDAVAQFMKDYAASTEWVNAKPAEAAPLIVAAGIVPNATLAEKAIPLCYITDVSGAAMKSALAGYLQVLFNADPASVGGSMPGDDFYFAG
ncbi:ABC transporter substrate-binding protein [Demequina lutea]|uniref:NitT/TauT family transport system substrate-binding protein n=1 Tax=Demequina lutea TaxID=431489 RepID=A0A7Y9ZG28_9MICO|nr:ABC transporter substrate-binding protein [Demequina lutea]NYI42716.1 NitT/TauT family transport system substrate-binding protein [Demequina lutea]